MQAEVVCGEPGHRTSLSSQQSNIRKQWREERKWSTLQRTSRHELGQLQLTVPYRAFARTDCGAERAIQGRAYTYDLRPENFELCLLLHAWA